MMFDEQVPDSGTQDTSGTPESGDNINDFIAPMNLLNKINQEFDVYFNNIVQNSTGLFSYSSKVQEFDIKEITKELKRKVKKGEPEDIIASVYEQELNKLLNTDLETLKSLDGLSVSADRKKRYKIFKEIPEINYIADRALKVMINNILITNAHTKKFMNLTPNVENSQHYEALGEDINSITESLMRTVISYFNIPDMLKNDIVPNMLTYGNFFVEIVDFKALNNIITSKDTTAESLFLFESTDIKKFKESKLLLENSESAVRPQKYDKMSQLNDLKNILKGSNLIQENSFDAFDFIDTEINKEESRTKTDESELFNLKEISKLDFKCISDLYLSYISPENVIILKSNNITYGYIVFEDIDSSSNEVDIFARLREGASSKGSSKSKSYNTDTQDLEAAELQRVIKDYTKNIFDTLKDELKNFKETFGAKSKFDDLDPEIRNNINVILLQKIKEKHKIKVRIVSPSSIVDFSSLKDKYAPYGNSIFEPMVGTVKQYTLALLSSIVSRLSRASVIRKWNLEVGSRRNHNELVQEFNKSLKNKSVSFDDIAGVKNIAQVMTDYKDIVTIKKNGQQFVDMEIMPLGDRGLPLNDLNDLRQELITSTNIPPTYLGIGDVGDLRESLVNLNINFANLINTYQSNVEASINKLLDLIITKILEKNSIDAYFKMSNFLGVTLNAPLVLTIQANEAVLSSVSNIIAMLKQNGIKTDAEYILKTYVPQMDWKQIISSGEEAELNKTKESILGRDTQDSGAY